MHTGYGFDLWMIDAPLSKAVDKPVETVDNSVNKYDADHKLREIRASNARTGASAPTPDAPAGRRCARGCRGHAVRDNAVRDNIGTVTFADIPSVAVAEVPSTAAAAVVLLDVREDDEWALGHAPGALHIPMGDVPSRLGEIDMDAEVYVVCRQGGRSIRVVQYLNRVGFDAIQVNGGMVAWQKIGLPLTTDDGRPAKIY